MSHECRKSLAETGGDGARVAEAEHLVAVLFDDLHHAVVEGPAPGHVADQVGLEVLDEQRALAGHEVVVGPGALAGPGAGRGRRPATRGGPDDGVGGVALADGGARAVDGFSAMFSAPPLRGQPWVCGLAGG